MNTLTGIGKEDRKRLSELFRETKGTISVTDAPGILKITSTDAAKMLQADHCPCRNVPCGVKGS